MRTLIVILIGLSIFFAGCAKRDVISGFPEKEAVKWRPGAGTVIAVGSVALLSVFAYIDSKSLFKRPAAVAEWCFCPRCTLYADKEFRRHFVRISYQKMGKRLISGSENE